MAIIKCKMCGGDVELAEDKTFGTCEYCGNTMTFPKVSDEQRAAAFNRGNHFRRIGEFDKALAVYERIVADDDTDAEAHWCCALCRFGIEYVEDPVTYEWMPTCHRASFDSFLEDVDYLAALEHSDGITRRQYQKDASKIAEVQRGILATSQNAEPYDVFISYKELDDAGNRTRDSILAQDVYYQLTEKGWRVFFSRISLEYVPGTQYEPYIFAALNSAKVMIVVGTSAENLNAVWVKNEWSRYLAMMRKDRSKLLIPCYRDMDPYDLPEQLSVLMSYDMGKIGFIQDLIRGVDKVLGAEKAPEKETVKETVVVQQSGGGANIAPLLKRAFMFLEDGNFSGADEYCERVLDLDPENAQAYLGKLMAEQQVRKQEALADCRYPFDGSSNYQKAVRFGDETLSSALKGYVDHINERNENDRLTGIYNSATDAMNRAKTEAEFKAAASTFRTIPGFRNVDELAEQCLEKAEVCRKDDIYNAARGLMTGEKAETYTQAIEKFRTITGWKDSEKQIYSCRKKIEEIKAKEEAEWIEAERQRILKEQAEKERKAKAKKTGTILAVIAAVAITVILIVTKVIIPGNNYRKAVALAEAGNIIEAYESFAAMDGYKDSTAQAEKLYSKYISEKLRTANIGETVIFGIYEQDNNTSNGKEPIEWQVLAKENSRVLVISKHALDCRQYNAEWTDVTWENCSLRNWLNGAFVNKAFSTEEQAKIPTVTVTADKNPSYDTAPGKDTQDRIFLLSISESNRYFASDAARQCKPTAYAIAQGSYVNKDNGNCWWWLRSPGSHSVNAASVSNDGSAGSGGSSVRYGRNAVRPALWINWDA